MHHEIYWLTLSLIKTGFHAMEHQRVKLTHKKKESRK